MDKLPLELVDLVFSFVPLTQLVRYVTVSRACQYAVERRVFKSARVKSTELGYFAHVYTPSHRRATLQALKYDIILPEYPTWKYKKFERDEDKKANNEAFTAAIVDLFAILNHWETASHAVAAQGQFKLEMNASSPSDDLEARADNLGTSEPVDGKTPFFSC
jgi:hypothetical protein